MILTELKTYKESSDFIERILKFNNTDLYDLVKESTFLLSVKDQIFNKLDSEVKTMFLQNWQNAEIRLVAMLIDNGFDICETIYIWHDEPIKLSNSVKSTLQFYFNDSGNDMFELMRSFILHCLNDSRRFGKKNGRDIDFVKREIENLNTMHLPQQAVRVDNFDKQLNIFDLIHAHLKVRGYCMSDDEQADKLKKKYLELTGTTMIPATTIVTNGLGSANKARTKTATEKETFVRSEYQRIREEGKIKNIENELLRLCNEYEGFFKTDTKEDSKKRFIARILKPIK